MTPLTAGPGSRAITCRRPSGKGKTRLPTQLAAVLGLSCYQMQLPTEVPQPLIPCRRWWSHHILLLAPLLPPPARGVSLRGPVFREAWLGSLLPVTACPLGSDSPKGGGSEGPQDLLANTGVNRAGTYPSQLISSYFFNGNKQKKDIISRQKGFFHIKL